MAGVFKNFPKGFFVLAGVACGAAASLRRSGQQRRIEELQRAVHALEDHLAAARAEQNHRLEALETKVEEHAAHLADSPSTTQIVGAMEELLARTLAGLDERLSTQAHSIELLQSTVTQTDELLERVLEAIDAMRPAEVHGPGEP